MKLLTADERIRRAAKILRDGLKYHEYDGHNMPKRVAEEALAMLDAKGGGPVKRIHITLQGSLEHADACCAAVSALEVVNINWGRARTLGVVTGDASDDAIATLRALGMSVKVDGEVKALEEQAAEPAPDQSGPGLEFTAKLSQDRTCCVITLGRVQLELPRSQVVRLAQTLLAMAGVMVDG